MLAPFATARATQGMVASIDHLASGAGVAMLRAGGSAADAAVAASAVLAVTAQHTCGMGGDVWALVHHSPGEPPAALNASGRSGSGADLQRLLDEGHTTMPLTGDPRSIPVPGCVDGWLALHDRFGRLRLAQVFEPAIQLAENGFPLSQACASALRLLVDVPHTEDYFGAAAAGAATGSPPLSDSKTSPKASPKVGAIIRRPGVANALRAVCENGRAGFYEGEFGEDLIALGQGEYSSADLTQPLADWVEPLQIEAWGHRIWTVPPNSQGYLTLAAAWIAAGLAVPTNIDDPTAVHLLAEAAKQAAYDRIAVLHEHADGHDLLSSARLLPRRALISPDTASDVGNWPQRSGDTNYLAAVDADRMGVSLIQSNASGWGAHCFTARNRISLQNRGIGFSLQPGHVAQYGPNKRPPHTLSPVLVQTPAGALRSVMGTMGGDNQPQVLLQLLARLLHGGATPGEAIAAGRWYWSQSEASLFETWTDNAPLQLVLEGHAGGGSVGGGSVDGLAADGLAASELAADLAARGHNVRQARAFEDSFGHAHVIAVEEAPAGSSSPVGSSPPAAGSSILAGASDPRMLTSAALGY